jgi:hypothetical protein
MTPNLAGSASHPSPFPQTHGTPTDFLSPLTSPALGPSPNPLHSFRQASISAIPSPVQIFPPLPSPSFGPTSTASRSKRAAVSEVDTARKRASPIVKPIASSKTATGTKRTSRTRPRGDSVAQSRASPLPSPLPSGAIEPVGDVPNSTPSPVDLSTTFSMPPPAVPVPRTSPTQEMDAIMEEIPSADDTPVVSANGSPSLAPVTPASLMNLGHLATQPAGLKYGTEGRKETKETAKSSYLSQPVSSSDKDGSTNSGKRDKAKDNEQVKAVPKGKVAIPKSSTGVRQSPAILPMMSSAIKPGTL